MTKDNNKKSKQLFAKIIGILLIITSSILIMTSCSTNYEIRGLNEYFDGRSSVEIDHFFGVDELTENFECLESDYYYSFSEEFPFYNVCEATLLYFRYDENEYVRAKEYYIDAMPYLGNEAIEIYGNYMFYDYYGNRPKDEYYHCDDYPEAFKRVAFNDANHTIVFLGIYTSDKMIKELEQDLLDWGAFLKKYYGEFYSFDE